MEGNLLKSISLLFLFLCLGQRAYQLPLKAQQQPSGPTVSTKYGILEGRQVESSGGMGVNIFLGIPYAAPPIGRRRFAAPENPISWSGVRVATEHGAQCLQRIIPEDPVLKNVPYKEDCLFLDVYTPASSNDSATTQALRPVMLYVHGGGYYGGTGAKYNFTNTAFKGVTVVTINYRLDVFGFLSTEDEAIPGNFGILDQIQALSWVKENIAAFGGNPRDITVFGGSSGAASTSILTLSPLAQGTFQKAIMTSGSALSFWGVVPPNNTVIVPREIAQTLGGLLHCPRRIHVPDFAWSFSLLGCLRSKTGEQIIVASRLLQKAMFGAQIWTPVVETTFGVLPDSPLKLLTAPTPKITPVQTMRGYMKDDGSFFVTDPEDDGITLTEFKAIILLYVASFSTNKSARGEIVQAVVDEYLPSPVDDYTHFQIRQALIDAMTDYSFAAPMFQEAVLYNEAAERSSSGMLKSLSSSQDDTDVPVQESIQTFAFEYGYRPSYSSDAEWMGVSHMSEKGAILGLPQGPDPFEYSSADSSDWAVSDVVQTLWTNFARYGNPTPTSDTLVTWPPFTNGRPEYSGDVMSIKQSPTVGANQRAGRVTFWTKTIPDIGNE